MVTVYLKNGKIHAGDRSFDVTPEEAIRFREHTKGILLRIDLSIDVPERHGFTIEQMQMFCPTAGII